MNLKPVMVGRNSAALDVIRHLMPTVQLCDNEPNRGSGFHYTQIYEF